MIQRKNSGAADQKEDLLFLLKDQFFRIIIKYCCEKQEEYGLWKGTGQ